MQPVSNGQQTRISGTAAGTTEIRDADANFVRVIIPTLKTGTVSFYDTTIALGTSSASFLCDIQNTVGTIPQSVEMGFRVRNGLVGVSGGTTDLLVVTS
jgi:hypothetical protein